jgi:hypothetical protein
MNQLRDSLIQVLSESERNELRDIISISSDVTFYDKLRSFFHRPEIFDKTKSIYDPTRISFEIFINKKSYEF